MHESTSLLWGVFDGLPDKQSTARSTSNPLEGMMDMFKGRIVQMSESEKADTRAILRQRNVQYTARQRQLRKIIREATAELESVDARLRDVSMSLDALQ